jgi:mono/diheme cytochrome c family protein
MKRTTLGYASIMSAGPVLLVVGSLWGCGGNGGASSATGLPSGKATRAQVLQGRYLVTAVGDCTGCHGGNNNPGDPNWLAGYSAANNPAGSFPIGPFTTYAANITQDKATGIGNWTSQDIFNALRNGKDPQGKYLCPPMPWTTFRNMTDSDIWAIVAYLQSVKAVSNNVTPSQGPPGADGQPDWSSAYQHLQPLPAYPAGNENSVP